MSPISPPNPAAPHPPRPGKTFRATVREEAERLWRLQCVGLGGFVLVVVLLPILGPSDGLPVLQVVVCLFMAIGSYAAWRIFKRMKCPHCGKQLAYLLEDKRMGVLRGTSTWGIPRGLVSRHGLPDDLFACPYCHHPFDALPEENPPATSQSPHPSHESHESHPSH